MKYVFVALGLILIVFSWKNAWRQVKAGVAGEDASRRLENLDRRVAALENERVVASDEAELLPLDKVEEKIDSLSNKFVSLEDRLFPAASADRALIPDQAFSAQMRRAQAESIFEAVREAYASGENVTEIAQRLGKGKGEVQLILNLPR